MNRQHVDAHRLEAVYPTAAERGLAVLGQEAKAGLVAEARHVVEEGRAAWQWDPQVPGVAGLIEAVTGKALVIVYADGDWEASQDLWQG